MATFTGKEYPSFWDKDCFSSQLLDCISGRDVIGLFQQLGLQVVHADLCGRGQMQSLTVHFCFLLQARSRFNDE